MIQLSAPAALCYLSLILTLGPASAWLVRLSEGSAFQTSCHRLFLASLGLVGVATLISISWGWGYCLFSGSTLSLMAVFATWDIGAARASAC